MPRAKRQSISPTETALMTPPCSRSDLPSYPAPPSPRSPGKKRAIRDTICQNCACQSGETNLWRSNRDPPRFKAMDNVLCNACGLWRNEHGTQRPKEWWFKRRSSTSPTPSSSSSSVPPPTRAPITRQRRRRSTTDNIASPAHASNHGMKGMEEAVSTLLNLGGSRPHQQPQQRSSSPAYRRPSWLYNQSPPAPRAIAPPGGFLPPPTPSRGIISIADLLNPSNVGQANFQSSPRYHPYDRNGQYNGSCYRH
ncbi:hypothetical protein I302_103692 [Kwoniella bestiolae CBS 10118]|uniref:GATA-type domain-containing protein n=1 Tax=Kwoniella bestiolae CBS 10118 TaxID=1296100 RepID=A0A1B9G934_9TREE|nr:hypothetical protein I302_02397 [Kwoniella bestiolae CBS 10118]OCF27555.1 hypothetical protein I302_02397 [Kwoniella bestiolae CBS 10118]